MIDIKLFFVSNRKIRGNLTALLFCKFFIVFVLVLLTSSSILGQVKESIIKYKSSPFVPYLWPSADIEDDPVEKSEDIGGIVFTGRFRAYTYADTWYPTWASDGNLYSPYTDGTVGGILSWSRDKKFGEEFQAVTGAAKITGNNPLNLNIESLGVIHGPAAPYVGRYPCGSLVHNGVWYHGTYCLDDDLPGYNYDKMGPFVGFHISTDYGKTWNLCPLAPENPLFGESGKADVPVKIGSPHFVDFGKNLEHSPDGKAYLVAHGASLPDPNPRPANLGWIMGDEIYLTRVTPNIQSINNKNAYEYFGGHDKNGKPIWTNDFNKIKPLFEWNNKCGCVTMTYNPGLKKYLMCITDGWPTMKTMDTYVLESDNIIGPWKMVTYLEKFGQQAYFVNIPSKFISEDGEKAWLCYSANFTNGFGRTGFPSDPPGSRYGMVLQEIEFPNVNEANVYPAKKDKIESDPIKSNRNKALKAFVSYSSVGDNDGELINALNDGIVNSSMHNSHIEWYRRYPRGFETINLRWNHHQQISKIWIFGRNIKGFNPIPHAVLVFSDGSSIKTGEIPVDISKAREISFPVKTVEWVTLIVDVDSIQTRKIGISEVAVF